VSVRREFPEFVLGPYPDRQVGSVNPFSFDASEVFDRNKIARDLALATEGAWGVWENMPPQLANAFAAGPDALPTALNQSLAWNYPRTRFGQYTEDSAQGVRLIDWLDDMINRRFVFGSD